MMDVQPAMRSNADYIFLTKEKSGVLREKIYKNWGSSVPNARVFNQIMDAATLDYGCLVIDNKNNSSSRISDSFARFKADYDLAERRTRWTTTRYVTPPPMVTLTSLARRVAKTWTTTRSTPWSARCATSAPRPRYACAV